MHVHRWLTKPEWINLMIIVLFFSLGILPALWFAVFGDLPAFWLREDGLYESCAALACLFGSIISFIAFYYSNSNGRVKRNFWIFLFALALLFLAGEEISWGQRLFGFEIPAKILQSNFQNEFNFHNTKFFQSRNNFLSEIVTHLLIGYLLVLPLGLTIFPTFQKAFVKIRIPIPSFLVSFIVLSIKITRSINYKTIYGSNYSRDYIHLGEASESLLELCLLLVAVELLIKYTKLQRTFLNTQKSSLL